MKLFLSVLLAIFSNSLFAQTSASANTSVNTSTNANTNINANEDMFKHLFANNVIGVRKALEKGANINQKSNGNTSLHIAISQMDPKKKDKKMINLLLEKNADVNAKNESGRTPLMLALRKNDLDLAQKLVEMKADINAVDDKGTSALMWAAYEGRTETVRFLLGQKADPNLVNSVDKTALMYAKERRNKDAEKLLTEAGAKE